MQNETQRFVDAVHRRLVVTRVLEQLGRGIFAGSVLAAALIAVAIWQSIPTEPLLFLCFLVGALIGGGVAIANWPTRLAAAAEADRQLGLDDLLTTVLLSVNGPDEDFGQAMAAMADARCRLHSPSDVLLRQLGGRSWSGIALAMSIAVTLAVIPLGASRSSATDGGVSVLLNEPTALPTMHPSAENPPILPRNIDPMNEAPSINPASDGQVANQHAAGNYSLAEQSRGSTSGAGGGSTTADQSQAKFNDFATVKHPQAKGGTAASGGGGSGKVVDQRGETTGGRSTGSSAPVQRWSGDGNSRVFGPFTAASEDRVPAEDRDLMRDYFQQ